MDQLFGLTLLGWIKSQFDERFFLVGNFLDWIKSRFDDQFFWLKFVEVSEDVDAVKSLSLGRGSEAPTVLRANLKWKIKLLNNLKKIRNTYIFENDIALIKVKKVLTSAPIRSRYFTIFNNDITFINLIILTATVTIWSRN